MLVYSTYVVDYNIEIESIESASGNSRNCGHGNLIRDFEVLEEECKHGEGDTFVLNVDKINDKIAINNIAVLVDPDRCEYAAIAKLD